LNSELRKIPYLLAVAFARRCLWTASHAASREIALVSGSVAREGKTPWERLATRVIFEFMNLLLILVVLLLLFGGGGFYFGGPAVGGGGVGLILLICLIIFLMGGFRSKS
jgi:hypothetical protein